MSLSEVLAALLAAALIFTGVPALAAPLVCPATNALPIAPNAIHGVDTLVQTNPKAGRGIAYTVHPDLAGLDLAAWMRHLEQAGVNMGELFLQPGDRLRPSKSIISGAWDTYVNAVILPYGRMTPAQQTAYQMVRSQITAENGVQGITADQQVQVLLAFLRQLEALKRARQICGNVQFVVVERRWFPTNEPLAKQFASEAVYTQTLADLVNRAGAAGLGHWLAGFLLTEHTNTNMNQLLPIAVDLATRINRLTRNWLMSHLMLLAGGGFGDEFGGIDRVICPANAGQRDSGYQFQCRPGQPLDFFGLIAKQTGSFAFAYKLFNWKTAPTPFSYCIAYIAGCRPGLLSPSDWIAYLDDNARGLGFHDLAAFVSANAARYPNDANVIFIGDATDSLYKMTRVVGGPAGDALMPRPSLIALATLFRNAARGGGGWLGRLFMEAYGHEDFRFDTAHRPLDNGSYLFYVDYSPFNFTGTGQVSENTQSRGYWRAWPALPSVHP
jgi:hypothetical protein